MKPASAKGKGRIFQQWVRDLLIEISKDNLEEGDIKSTTMGESGEDIQLSPAARKVFPFNIECKSRNSMAIYKDYAQAQGHGKHEAVVVVKQNRDKPLVIVDAVYFFNLFKKEPKNPSD